MRGCLSSLPLSFRNRLCVRQWKLRHLKQMSPFTLTTDDFDTGGCTLYDTRYSQLLLLFDGWSHRSLEIRPHGSNSHSTDLDLSMQHTGGSPLYGRLLCSILNREVTGASSSLGDTIFCLSLALMSPVLLAEMLYLRGPGSQTNWIHLAKKSELEDKTSGFVQDGWITLCARISFMSCRQFALEILRQRREVEEKEGSSLEIDNRMSVEIEGRCLLSAPLFMRCA